MTCKRRLQSIALLALPFSLIACGANGPESGEDDVGSAEIAITQVPAGVQCIQLLAQGSRSVETLYSVTTNQPTVLSMNKLPVGQIQFSGAAYSGTCASGVAGQTPVYLADPVVAEVQTGTPASVTLNMRRNGQAAVTVDFEVDCGAAGSACSGAADCCSGLTCTDANGDGLTECAAPTCGAEGSACSGAADCCSGLTCTDADGDGLTECAAPTCGAAGSVCSVSADCCSLVCTDPDADGISNCS